MHIQGERRSRNQLSFKSTYTQKLQAGPSKPFTLDITKKKKEKQNQKTKKRTYPGTQM